jgi:capsular polysaccharide biosynthesis protein
MKMLQTGDVLDPDVTIRHGLESDIVVSEAVIIPGDTSPRANAYCGGIVDSSGEEIAFGRVIRKGKNRHFYSQSSKHINLERAVIAHGSYRYAGVFSWHYGHFLIEGLGNISIHPGSARSMPHLFHDFTKGRRAPHIAFFLSCLGVLATPVASPLRIRGELVIPPSRVRIKRSVHKDQALIYREIAESVLSQTKGLPFPGDGAIYLSRSRVNPDKRRMVNEAALEDALAGIGFTIIHPHELEVKEQIRLISRARLIVGPIGAAMVSAVFSNRDCPVIYLCHGRTDQSFPILDSISERSATYCYFDEDHRPKDNWHIDVDAFMSCFSSNGHFRS